ncbi:hypothetical protein [Paludibacterium denitrificans]|uniref:hypothetical protein n=1 Tax=Paludibacterium denitrificans TaxID=2675226 RepID=UPI001E490E62|nr:hypothetical protein [Paludibacterium denitrificans]
MKQPGSGFDDRAEALTKQVNHLMDKVKTSTQASIDTNMANIHRLRAIVMTVSVVLVLLVLGGGVLLYRRVFGMLGGEPALAVDMANRIAAGDLTQRIPSRPGSLLEARPTCRSSCARSPATSAPCRWSWMAAPACCPTPRTACSTAHRHRTMPRAT